MPRIGAHILGLAGTNLSHDEASFFRETTPLGFILFSRNLESAEQIRRLTDDLRSVVGREAPILIDQEGGRVQRLRPPLARDWLPPLDFAARAGKAAERALWLRARLIAHELRALGIDTNCVPGLDIAREETHPFLRNRCLGGDADTVTRLGRAVAEGCLSGGVLPVMKHMPGHGRGTVDSHLEPPGTDAGPEALFSEDFLPFQALSDLPFAMTAHMIYRSIDPRNAATVSGQIIALMRERTGFKGLLMTDDLSMEALGGSVADRARAARSAGCNLILHCNGTLPEMEEVAREAGYLSEAELEAAEGALAHRRSPDPIDISAAEAELEALMKAGDR